MSDTRSIGVFDSGVGGLTVAAAIHKLLPMEVIQYYGDTAHLPYGEKSPETIKKYSQGIAQYLLSKDIKLLVIACNTASAWAFQEVVDSIPASIPVINVIDPVVDYIENSKNLKHVGVIATAATVLSGVYSKKIHASDSSKVVSELATPLLVPMIEEGFIENEVSYAILENYLNSATLKDIQALVLGCTHYPLIKPTISKILGPSVELIDNAQSTAELVKKILVNTNSLNSSAEVSAVKAEVSDYTATFEQKAKGFFGANLHLSLNNIWNNE